MQTVKIKLKELPAINEALTKIGDHIEDPQLKWDLGITLQQINQYLQTYTNDQLAILNKYKESTGDGYFKSKKIIDPLTKAEVIDVESDIIASNEVIKLGEVTQEIKCSPIPYKTIVTAISPKEIGLLADRFVVNS